MKPTKESFYLALDDFAKMLPKRISLNGEWTMRGFIDVFKNVHALSEDTKVISKMLELHLFPFFLEFGEQNGYSIELATHQNWYPDLTFVCKKHPEIKFAVDLKTTYRSSRNPALCNGFTLGSHGEYFVNRKSHKNVQYPYSEYSGHFCLGIIYSRFRLNNAEEMNVYSLNELDTIPAVIGDFIFFAHEKWRIASDKCGSGNTANIGSIKNISDILSGNGTFVNAGEEYFDDYWANYGKIEILSSRGERKKLTSFSEYLIYRRLPANLLNKSTSKQE